MIASILAYIDIRGSGENTAETAFRLALRHNAHVEGLHVRADAGEFIAREPFYSNLDTLRSFSESFDREAAQREATSADAFATVAKRLDVAASDTVASADGPTAQWVVQTGTPRDVVSQHARVADVCVIGREHYGGGNPTMPVIEGALFDSGRPVLIAPPHAPDSVGGYVVIAWNRSAASARALAAALPFLDRAERVRLVYVDTGAKAGPSVQQAADYLKRYDIDAEAVTMAPERGSVASTLLTDAQYADLLVMGAYSHSRFRDVVLGGVTRDILQNATIPVLMVH